MPTERQDTIKRLIAIAITQGAFNGELFPAEWAEEDETHPDWMLGSGNNYWLRSHKDNEALYIQPRDPAHIDSERKRKLVKIAALIQEETGIEVKCRW